MKKRHFKLQSLCRVRLKQKWVFLLLCLFHFMSNTNKQYMLWSLRLLSSLLSFFFYLFRILNASVLSLRLSASTLTKRGKVFLVHATKAYRDSGGIAPLTFNLGTRWRWWLTSGSGSFTAGKGLLSRRLGETHSLSGHFGEKSPAPTGIRTPERPS